MKQAPVTIKGLFRKRIVQMIETIIGIAVLSGALLFVCLLAHLIQMVWGVS